MHCIFDGTHTTLEMYGIFWVVHIVSFGCFMIYSDYCSHGTLLGTHKTFHIFHNTLTFPFTYLLFILILFLISFFLWYFYFTPLCSYFPFPFSFCLFICILFFYFSYIFRNTLLFLFMILWLWWYSLEQFFFYIMIRPSSYFLQSIL